MSIPAEKSREYTNLVTMWSMEKTLEQQANARRLTVEKRILDLLGSELKNSGTNNFPNNLKILTGLSATCVKEAVNELYEKFVSDELPIKEFPFKHRWEPEVKMLNEIRLRTPSLYEKFFADVVTIKPKKPAFEVKKEKN